MHPDTPPNTPKPEQPSPLDVLLADDIAVSASDLIDMIRNGNGSDVNELVRRTLSNRNAA
jgi:hypothetical protein